MTLTTTTANQLQLVQQHDGKAVTTSLKVAEVFSKKHAHVMESVRKLLEDRDVVSRSNFRLAEYSDEQNKPRPMYEMDRDGFTLLAMGFTGKQALQFKLSYIDAFNKAESFIKNVTYTGSVRPELEATDIFKSFNEIGKLIGFDENMAAFSANNATRKIININVLELMGVTRLIAPSQIADLTVTDIGSKMNPPRIPTQVNEMLLQLGYQVKTKVKMCPYEATEKGKPFARLHDVARTNAPGTSQQLRWYPTILDQEDVQWVSGLIPVKDAA